MASITIRNLDDDVKKRLRKQAAEHGRSLEAEAREILKHGAKGPVENRESGAELFDRIHRRIMKHGGVELKLPLRRGRPVPDLA